MNKKNLLVIVTALLFSFAFMTVTVSAETDEWIDGEKHDWRTSWDANQNNAYIDLINGIYDLETEISLEDDYITSEQFFNVLSRVVQEHSYWDIVYCDDVIYSEDGYVKSVVMRYKTKQQCDDTAKIRERMHQIADAAEFAKSYIDDSMTDIEKALVCHDYIAQRTAYREPQSDTFGWTEDLWLKHIGQCSNMSKAYQYLLNYAQIPYADNLGFRHEWTALYLDGKWYTSDVTFDSRGPGSDPDGAKYFDICHQFFLCGQNRHYEGKYLQSFYKGYDIIGQMEYDEPQNCWDLRSYYGNIAYHASAGEEHGKLFYLSLDTDTGKRCLTIRDSMAADADVEQHKDSVYEQIDWGDDKLFGYRGNNVYLIDWDTLEEILVACIEDNTFYTVDANGTKTAVKDLNKEGAEVRGIICENGGLFTKIMYSDYSWEGVKAYSYKEVSFQPVPLSEKVELSGPSEQPGELIYNIPRNIGSFPDIYVTIEKRTDKFSHPDGYSIPGRICGFQVYEIGEKAFQNTDEETLGGKLIFPGCIRTICDYAFENCPGISGDLDVHNVYNIYRNAFNGCTGLDGKVILCPERALPEFVFNDCSGITEVVNLSGYVYLGYCVFDGCTSLEGHYDLSDTFISDRAFYGCSKISIEPELIASTQLGDDTFYGCENISGTLSIPECTYIRSRAIRGTNITRVTDTDKVQIMWSAAFSGKLTGIMSFPALEDLRMGALEGENNLTAIRFTNPDTIPQDDRIECFPSSTDVALFVVKDSAVENVIKDKWTYGVNYWYVDDVIAEGELENGVTWAIRGDGEMTFSAEETPAPEGSKKSANAAKRSAKAGDMTRAGDDGQIVINGYGDEDAPWEDYKQYVDSISVKSQKLCVGTNAINGFENLEKVNMIEGSTYEDGAFAECENLQEEAIETVDQCQHEYSDWTLVREATCTETELMKRTCGICGKVETKESEALGHSWHKELTDDKVATCQEEGLRSLHCDTCGVSQENSSLTVPKAPHNWGAGEITTQPTCTEDGIKTIACSNCDEVTKEPVPATGHDMAKTEAVPAKCTKDGNIEYWTCSNCHGLFSDKAGINKITKEETVTVAAHDWEKEYTTDVAATCTEDGSESFHCKNCDAKSGSRVIAAAGHKLTEHPATAATVKQNGTRAYWSCDRCGKFFSDAAGTHEIAENSWIIAKLAQPLQISPVKKTVKYSKVRKKAQTVSGAIKFKTKAQGTVTYKGVGTTAKAKKALKINAKTGKITVAKKTKKGTYKMKVTVTAAGTAKYKAGSKLAIVTIKVR